MRGSTTTHPSRRFARTAAAVLVATGLLLVSCAKKDVDYENVTKPSIDPGQAGAPAVESGPTSTRPPYTPTYEPQSSCKVKGLSGRDPNDPAKPIVAECGLLSVPEDRKDPGGTKLELQVVRVKSSNPTPALDPIVYLEGGPGGSALVRIELWIRAFAPLLKNRDLIIMDQRGTGYSEPTITCAFEWEKANLNTEVNDVMKKCYDRLAGSKFNLDAYDTEENAADFADLRVALGIESWNLFGISYGTRLALQIMNDAPEGVRSVIIDSVFPGGVEAYNEQPANAARAFKAVFEACAADAACNSANPDLENALAEIIDALNRTPINNNNPFEGDGAKYLQFDGVRFVSFVFQTLYDTEAIHELPALITFARKDPVGTVERYFQTLRNSYDPGPGAPRSLRPGYDRSSSSDGFHFTVMCAEEAAGSDLTKMADLVPPIHPSIKQALVDEVARTLDICKFWEVSKATVAQPTASIPTLVLSGTFDPITPPSWGQLAQSKLPVSRFVQLEGAGHGVYLEGKCMEDLVDTFLADPPALGGNECPSVVGFVSLPFF